MFLGGKCRYCKEKIRSRYILLEIFSGIVFLLTALSLKITTYSTLNEFINLGFIYLFMCAIFIIGGIDKEKHEIHDGTILYGIFVSLAYGLFNAFRGISMKYSLVGFLSYSLIFLVIDVTLKFTMTKEDLPIGFGDIEYVALIGLFLGFGLQTISLILATIISVVSIVIQRLKAKDSKINVKNSIPLGYYLSISTAIVIICAPMLSGIAELINLSMI